MMAGSDTQSRILRALEAATARLEAAERERSEPLAIIGMSCRFPGAPTREAFWDLLRDGVDTVSEVPPDRFDVSEYFDRDPATPGATYTRSGGFLPDVDKFDAEFFGMSAREADILDPQQRLLMEVVSDAFERAGVTRNRLRDSQTGVFVGITNCDYGRQITRSLPRLDAYHVTGNTLNAAAGRVAHQYGLHGPAMAVDTACSSSLTAVHLACQSLRAQECDLAVAGGVNLNLLPDGFIALAKAGVLSRDGRCKSFDASADGMGRSEGCGVVLLKRLSDALRADDEILALIRGSAVNQDGASAGLTVPSGRAQEQLVKRALDNARLQASDISYIEAHGTGTLMGDPIELRALGSVLGTARDAAHPLIVGSVKANIAHAESAAGIAGIIKVVLCFQHRMFTPQIHLREPSTKVDWSTLNIQVSERLAEWPSDGKPRRAGVSGFGFSGTNVHVVLEEAPSRSIETGGETPPRLMPPIVLALSAVNENALREMASRYADQVRADPNLRALDLCYSAAISRDTYVERAGFVATSRENLIRSLSEFACVRGRVAAGSPGEVTFVFAGQGDQHARMGRALYETEPEFRKAIEECNRIVGRDVLWVDGDSDHTAYAQPALFAFEYALAALWQSWGVQASAVMGHSVGEYAAACLAGVMSAEDALGLVVERGRLMGSVRHKGSMVAVFAPEERVRDVVATVGGCLAIAAVNGRENVVLSGECSAIDAAVAHLSRHGLRSKPLAVSHAFHSPLMAPVLDPFREALSKVTLRPPSITFVSTLTGAAVEDELATAEYWVQQITRPVLYESAVLALREDGRKLFLEIGPRSTFSDLGSASVEDVDERWIASFGRGGQDLASSLAELYASGADIDWPGVYQGTGARRIALPTYPFQRKRYWFEQLLLEPSPRAEALYEVAWVEQEFRPPRAAGPSQWLILADSGGVANDLATSIRARGESVEVLDAWRSGIEHLPERNTHINVVHLSSLDIPYGTDARDLNLAQGACMSAVSLLAKLAALAAPGRVWFVTRGAQFNGRAVLQAPLWGLARVAALEHPSLFGGIVDLDPDDGLDTAPLLTEIDAARSGHIQAAHRGGRRFVPRMRRSEPSSTTSLRIAGDCSYLITGGSGGLGLEVAGWLVGKGARHVFLVARREPAPEILAKLQRWKANVHFVPADVADFAALQRVVAGIDRVAPLRGFVHAAGTLDDSMLWNQTEERFTKVMAGKARGALNLDALLRYRKLDFAIFFSSLASILGSPGQANYAAANALLDALAENRRQRGEAALSINWGPWRDAGMAMRLGNAERLALRARGLELLTAQQVIWLLERAFAADSPHVAAANLDFDLIRRSLAGSPLPIIDDLAPPHDQEAPTLTNPVEIDEFVVYLRERVRNVMRSNGADVPTDVSLQQLGLDSIMATELKNRIARELQIEVSIRDFLSGPTVTRLAGLLFEKTARCRLAAIAASQADGEMESVVL